MIRGKHARVTRRTAIAAGLGGLALLGGRAKAQSGKGAEWDRLVAAAEKEGLIAVGGPLDPAARDYTTRAWAKEFPRIEMQWTVAGGFEWASRVRMERAGNKFLWDIYLDGPNVEIYQMAAEGTLSEVTPQLILPDLKDAKTWRRPWDDMFLDHGKKMLSMFASPSSVWFNAKTVDPAKVAAQGLKIMLNPAYKGRIAWFDPRTAGPGLNFAVMLYVLLGKDGLRQLVVDQEPVFYNRGSPVTEALVRGKADFGIAIQNSDLQKYQQSGLSFDVRPIGHDAKTSYLGFGGAVLAIFNPAPHQNAAKLFLNWVLTQPVQEGFSHASQWDSTRTDVPPVGAGGMVFIPGEHYVEVQKENMLPTRDEAMNYLRGLRPQ